jgi:hypothetical protein
MPQQTHRDIPGTTRSDDAMPDRTSLAHLAALTTGAARSRAGRTALTVLLQDAGHLAELIGRDVL